MLINPQGQIVARAGDYETIVYWQLDFQEVEKHRNLTKIHINRRNDIYDTVMKAI